MHRSSTDRYEGRGRALPMLLAVLCLAGCGAAPPAPTQERLALRDSVETLCAHLVDDLSALTRARRVDEPLHVPTLAVLPFVDRAGERQAAHAYGHTIAELVQGCLIRGRGLRVVERAQLSKVLDEQLDGALFTGAEAEAELGRLLQANLLVLGSVGEAGDAVVVSARITQVRDGIQLAAAEVLMPRAPIDALSRYAERTWVDALGRSLLLPGWGQAYNGRPVLAATVLVSAAALGAAAGVMDWRGDGAADDYNRGSRTDPAVVDRRHDAMHAYRARNGLLWTMGAVWALGAAHSALDTAGVFGARAPALLPEVSVGPAGARARWRF